MKNRSSLFAAAFVCLAGGFALLVPLGACIPPSDGGPGTGGTSGGGMSGSAGQSGSGGRAGTGGASVTCGSGGATGGTSVMANWALVREIVITCAGADCHADREPKLLAPAGQLSDADLYAKLTSHTSAKCGNRVLVNPCAPEESAFYLVQRPEACGPGTTAKQMPFGCGEGLCTSADYLEGVRQWIARGAPR